MRNESPSGSLLRSFARYLRIAMGGAFLALSLAAAPAQLSPQQVAQFMANPSALLAANPDGGAQLVSTIRDLVLSDPATLPALISLLANANAAQQAAIGSGLGQAATASVRTNPTLANQIQEAVAASGVQVAIASFAATTGNTQTAAAGGGGGGGIGGPTNGFFGGGGGGSGGGGGGGSNSGGVSPR